MHRISLVGKNELTFSQRKFLIKLETEYEPIQEGRGPKAWTEGRWGRPFCSSEAEFDCYGPYCANYLEAIKLVNENMSNLMVSCKIGSAKQGYS